MAYRRRVGSRRRDMATSTRRACSSGSVWTMRMELGLHMVCWWGDSGDEHG